MKRQFAMQAAATFPADVSQLVVEDALRQQITSLGHEAPLY